MIWHKNSSDIADPLWGESTTHKASNNLWCFLCSWHEQAVEQTVQVLVIWVTLTLIWPWWFMIAMRQASVGSHDTLISWAWFNIKMSSYQYRKSHCGEKMVIRSSYLHNGISYTGKMASLYWISLLYLSVLFAIIDPIIFITQKQWVFCCPSWSLYLDMVASNHDAERI